MKKIILYFLVFSFTTIFKAQTGIGTPTPDASARLEVSATNRGFLPPRVALTASNSASPVTSPANGLLVFNTASAGTGTNRVTPGYYYWDNVNSIWQRLSSDVNIGDIKTGMQTSDHNGWIRLDGRAKSTLSAAQQAQATALGIGNNLPNASNAFLVQNGNTLGLVSNSNSKFITQSNLPNVNFPTATTSWVGDHTHWISGAAKDDGNFSGGGANNQQWGLYADAGSYSNWDPGNWYGRNSGAAGGHNHTITVNSGGSGTALDITPQSLSVNVFIYLGL